MHARAVSLPELARENRRNTALSLTEGFAGAKRGAALAASSLNFAPRPQGAGSWAGDDGTIKSSLNIELQIYYRTRQLVLGMEKKGHRCPKQLLVELQAQENNVARELRPLHPLLFQRFSETQLSRFLRNMSFLKLSQGRWIFGDASLAEQWPHADGKCSFLLLYGRVSLFQDPAGAGDRLEVTRGAVFGETPFQIVDEPMRSHVAGAALCEEPCIVGVLTAKVIETAYADRAYGNARIAQTVRHVPALARAVKSDAPAQGESASEPGSVAAALRDLAKIATTIHIPAHCEVLSDDPLEESMLIVAKGGIDIKGDVRLAEKLESLPPKKVRLRVFIEKAEGLAGDSFFDKLDPYCIAKLGDFKRIQTPALRNAGVNPRWEYNGVMSYAGEQTLEFTVMDQDQYSADDLCGAGVLLVSKLEDGWKGKVELTRPKRGMFTSEETLEEPAGKLFVTIRWDFEKISALTRTPKERTWTGQTLFHFRVSECWGHEHLMLGALFKRTLEQATHNMPYTLTLDNLRVVAEPPLGEEGSCICWKVTRRRFADFIRCCGRERHFLQACRLSVLEKQHRLQSIVKILVQQWEEEEQNSLLRGDLLEKPAIEEAMDPSRFRVAYRGVRCMVTVRNALNLVGGGWFDKLDPYAIVRFKGAKQEFRTSVLQDAGGDPVWECFGSLVYQGETSLEVSVWDYDKYSADDLLATGSLHVEQFCSGFEGMVPLTSAGKKGSLKRMVIIISMQWDPPRELNTSFQSSASFQATGRSPG
mmetsp:Transcript_32104/g.70257  ORF Transcript_32104/g.70257 Transcript_32104/m.70257 type:complete len:760 (+) Transcript_32104:48-2327(+)